MNKLNSIPNRIFLYISLITILPILPTTQAETKTEILSSHGEPCSEIIRCNFTSSLSCDSKSKTCQCSNPHGMTYNKTMGKCLLNLGQKCNNSLLSGNSTFKGPECIKGATCNPSGICSCSPGFYKNIKTNNCTQSRLLGLGRNCTVPEECNQDALLTCTNGQCICDPELAIHNNKSYQAMVNGYFVSVNYDMNICVGKVNTSCYFDPYSPNNFTLCMEGSKCDEYVGNKGKCRCEDGYTETTQGLCGASIGMSCSTKDLTKTCADGLQCLGNKQNFPFPISGDLQCQCKNPNYQEYDSFEKVCRGLIGTFCNPNDPKSCVKGGVCIQRDNIFRCECGDGFVENLNSTCEIAHGSQCDYEIPTTDICDTQAKLMCIDNKCGCMNADEIYEHDRRQCLKPVGMRCEEMSDCVSNAHCFKSNTNNRFGYCRCDSGFLVTEGNTCSLQASPMPMEMVNELDIAETTSETTTDAATTTAYTMQM